MEIEGLNITTVIPRGFKLIAVTSMPGTGGVEARAYYNEERKLIYFLLVDPVAGNENAFGPIEMRCLKTLQITIGDVMEMGGKVIRYIEE